MRRFYVIYDGRACGNAGTDEASVLYATGYDRREAIKVMPKYGQCALYSYDDTRETLTDERWEKDFTP